MYLSAFAHRHQLYEITNRWLSDRLAPEDPLELSRIVTYDGFIAWQSLRQLSRMLYAVRTEKALHLKPIYHKKHLKDFLSRPGMETTTRLARIMQAYRQQPEYYYIGSPVTGYIAHDDDGRILGVARTKRPKRIAEKASRYAAQFIAKRIRDIAHQKRGPAPSRKPLILENLSEDLFVQAEQHMMAEVRQNGLKIPRRWVTIDDILGLKVVDTGDGESDLEALIDQLPNLTIVEKERHQGNYNATHYLIEQQLDFPYIRDKLHNKGLGRQLRDRGLPETGLETDFDAFLNSGHDHIRLDLIFTTFEELVESEIGRSMHETRIFDQRREQRNNISVNIEYIIEYLLAVALSPVHKIDEIPIKVWGRYLPDTLGEIIRKLHQIPTISLLNT